MNGHFNCTETSPWTCKETHDFSKAFHVFSITWNETAITWAVDDVEYFSQTTGTPQGLYVPQWPMFFILNSECRCGRAFLPSVLLPSVCRSLLLCCCSRSRTAVLCRLGGLTEWRPPVAVLFCRVTAAIQPPSGPDGPGTSGPYPARHVIDWARIYQQQS